MPSPSAVLLRWLILGASALFPMSVAAQVSGSIAITTALVLPDLSVRPVPAYHLRLIDSATGEAILLRTNLQGKVTQRVPAGHYQLESESPIDFQGRRYSWSMPVQVDSGQSIVIELANDNAMLEVSGTPVNNLEGADTTEGPLGQAASTGMSLGGVRQVAPEMQVYNAVRGGVFRVEAGLARGSGFLADTLGGVILTNDHVIGTATSVQVLVDSLTKVPAQVLARDPEADVAVLRIAPQACSDCPRLPLMGSGEQVIAGERILAIGYPLHQEEVLTTGIASSIRSGALISDVNINHGNSGGPMLTLDGRVVAINTFGDVPDNGGPGVSGSILISRADRVLSDARDSIALLPVPPYALLPVIPRTVYPLTDLRAVGDTVSLKRYRKLGSIDLLRFDLGLTTPVVAYARKRAFEEDIGADRKKREEAAGLKQNERFSEMGQARDWDQYVGDERVPVVSLQVQPQIAQTGGSILGQMLLGSAIKSKFKFTGDVRGLQLYRNQDSVPYIVGGHIPVEVYSDNRWVSMKDVADQGFYVFDPLVFMPDSAGRPPSIIVEVQDLKHTDHNVCRELAPEVIASIWNDFAAYYGWLRAQGFDEPFVMADPKPKHWKWTDHKFLPDCDWWY